ARCTRRSTAARRRTQARDGFGTGFPATCHGLLVSYLLMRSPAPPLGGAKIWRRGNGWRARGRVKTSQIGPLRGDAMAPVDRRECTRDPACSLLPAAKTP